MNAALGETTFHLDGRKLSVPFASIGFSERRGALASPPATAKPRSATSTTTGTVIPRTSGEEIGRCAWGGVAGEDAGAPFTALHARWPRFFPSVGLAGKNA